MEKGFNFRCFVLDDYLELSGDIIQDFRLFPNVESDHIFVNPIVQDVNSIAAYCILVFPLQ